MQTIARDLPNGDEPFEVAPPDMEFPFLKNGDSTSFVLTRYYKQTVTGYNRDRLAAKYLPGLAVDAQYPEALMLSESKPTRTSTALCSFTRTFAKIPSEQVVYSTLALTKPDPNSIVDVSTDLFSWNNHPDDDTTDADGYLTAYNGGYFADNGKVYYKRDVSTPSRQTITAGTFTVGYKGVSTAGLAWNASDATIAAAFNALATVIADGITVTASNQFDFTFGYSALHLTATAGAFLERITGTNSMTPGDGVFIPLKSSSVLMSLFVPARATLAAHGFDPNRDCFVYRDSLDSATAYSPGLWVVIDANTIGITDTGSAMLAVTAIGQDRRTYTAGTSRVRAQLVQGFYPPGEEIPLPAPATSDVALLNLAVGAETGYRTYDATSLEQWRDSPVYTQTVTKINVDNL